MKKIITSILAMLLVSSLAACSSSNPKKDVSSAVDESMASEGISSPSEQVSQADQTLENQPTRIVVADTAMYRGIISEIKAIDGQLHSFVLSQVEGTDFGAPSLKVNASEDTKFSFDFSSLQEGDYVEVFFGDPLEQAIKKGASAIAVNNWGDAEMIIFNGAVVSVTPDKEKEGAGSLLLTSLKDNSEWVFHYWEDTQLYVNINELTEGDKVNILFSGIATRSLPPQSNAIEIRPFSE